MVSLATALVLLVHNRQNVHYNPLLVIDGIENEKRKRKKDSTATNAIEDSQ